MLYCAILFCIWPLMSTILTQLTNYSDKINNNLISALHSNTSNILNITGLCTMNSYLLNYSILFSISYFIWDGYRILIIKSKSDYVYVVHHIISILFLEYIYLDTTLPFNNTLLILYCLGEVSNFFTYIVYHMIKAKYSNQQIYKYKICQCIWFSFIRVVVYTYYMPKFIYNINNNLMLIAGVILYGYGIYWSVLQITQTYSEYKENIIKKLI